MTIDTFIKPIKIFKEYLFPNYIFEELKEQHEIRRNCYNRFDVRLYLNSEWEVPSDEPSTPYLLYRWVHLGVLFLCLALSLMTCPLEYALKSYIYMTTWAQCFHLLQAALGAAVVTLAHRRRRGLPPRLLTLYGAHHATSVSLALAVTFVYWTFIFEPGVHRLTMAKIVSHGVNSVVMLLDLLLVSYPVILFDIVYPLCFGFIYTYFSIVYFVLGGTNAKGDLYIYKVLDWSRPANALSFAVIGMCILSIAFLLVWLLAALRRIVASKLKPTFIVVHI